MPGASHSHKVIRMPSHLGGRYHLSLPSKIASKVGGPVAFSGQSGQFSGQTHIMLDGSQTSF